MFHPESNVGEDKEVVLVKKPPEVKLEQIIQITELVAEELQIVLPIEWQKDLRYFLENYRKDFTQKKQPLRVPRALSLMCNHLDKWLKKKEYEVYQNNTIEHLRREVKKRIWILLKPEIQLDLAKFLLLNHSTDWMITDLKRENSILYSRLVKNEIKTEADLKLVLGEYACLLEKYKFTRRENTEWDADEIECRLDQFLQFYCTPGQSWGTGDLESFDLALYQKLYRLGVKIEKDELEPLLGDCGKELLTLYPPERQLLNPEIAREKLKEFLITELKPGYKWDFEVLKTFNLTLFTYIRDRVEGETIQDRIFNLLGEENKNLLLLCPLKLTESELIKKATGESASHWNEKLRLIAMQNFFQEIPKAQIQWHPKMITNWNNGFYCSLKSTYRNKYGKIDWERIIQKYVPKEYQDKFAWLECQIYLATGEYASAWDENLFQKAMSNFFKEVPESRSQWSPQIIINWNKAFYKSLTAFHTLSGQIDWKTIIQKYVPVKFQNNFLWKGLKIDFNTKEATNSFGIFEYSESHQNNSTKFNLTEEIVDKKIVADLLSKIEPVYRKILLKHFYEGEAVPLSELEVALTQIRLHLNEFQLN